MFATRGSEFDWGKDETPAPMGQKTKPATDRPLKCAAPKRNMFAWPRCQSTEAPEISSASIGLTSPLKVERFAFFVFTEGN
jgi:hypothetical protein